MGLPSPASLLFSSDEMELPHLYAILSARRRRAMTASTENENNNLPRQPCVDIDANQVVMRLIKKTGGAVHNIIGIVSLLAKDGVDVCIIADNENCRPQTKRASVERAAKREHSRILGLKTREELATLLQSENLPKEKVEELQKTIQSKEHAAYHIRKISSVC
jgi:hypothetical protein